MNNNSRNNLPDDVLLADEVRGIAAELDTLAGAERAAISDSQLAAIAAATAPVPATLKLTDAATVRQPASHRPMRFRTALRLGGSMLGLAAMVTVAMLLWPAGQSSSAVAASSGADAALALAEKLDEKLSLDAFDSLLADTKAMDTTLNSLTADTGSDPSSES
jgi:hypothetical protein